MNFALKDDGAPVLGVSYGLGVDSTAMLVGMVKQGLRPDFILFADVGSERRATYAYLPIIQDFLRREKFPPITTVQYEPKYAPYNTLEDNMLTNATLPGATFGRGNCSVKFKIVPQEKWERRFKGRKIIKLVGFEAGEEYRQKRSNQRAHTMKKPNYEYEFPLIQWGWDREECKARIREAGLSVPPKSSCIFCPNMKPEELYDLTPDERGRIVRMEIMAEPYNYKVHGLWREPRKDRPGSITEFLLQNNIEFTYDIIEMPKPQYFTSEEEYFCTLYHECCHSTGSANRLKRPGILKVSFGSPEYAREELIAEIGAAFLCAQSGIENRTIKNSAAYIANWLERLKNDKKLIIQASAAAERAVNYILHSNANSNELAA